MKVFEFGNPLRRKDHLEFYGNVRRELLKLAQIPKVYIDPSCLPADQAKVREIVERLGAHVAASAGDAGLTHHIFPFSTAGDPDDGQDYLRVQEIRGDRSFVHWWYLPESYDEYVPRDSVTDQVDKDPVSPPVGAWKVYLRWAYDSEKFNEWMSPVDYETQEAQEEHGRILDNLPKTVEAPALAIEPPAPLPSEMRRLAANKDGMPAKRSLGAKDPINAKRHKPTGPEVLIGNGQTIAPGVVRHSLLEPHRSLTDPTIMTSENISRGQLLPHAFPSLGFLTSQLQSSVTAAFRQPFRRDSSWFSTESIHELERQALPEFFNSRCPSKTPDLYVQIRNIIVGKYLEQGRLGFLFKAVQGLIAGDRNASRRVYDFLLKVDIIRLPEGRYPSPRPPTALFVPPEGPMLQDVINSFSSAGSYTLMARPDPPQQQSSAYYVPKVYCSMHSSVDCSCLRYSSTRMPNWQLCPTCFAEGFFPPGLSGKDFIRVDNRDPHQADRNGWTLHESSLLFAGLDLFGDNWPMVAEYVGTKTHVQCVLRFLQMPIEDVLLDSIEHGSNASFPFKESPNPILAQTTLLASVISPEVAAATAVHALNHLCQSIAVEFGPENITSAVTALAQVEAAKEGLAGAQRCAREMTETIDLEIEALCFEALCQQINRLDTDIKYSDKLRSFGRRKMA